MKKLVMASGSCHNPTLEIHGSIQNTKDGKQIYCSRDGSIKFYLDERPWGQISKLAKTLGKYIQIYNTGRINEREYIYRR